MTNLLILVSHSQTITEGLKELLEMDIEPPHIVG